MLEDLTAYLVLYVLGLFMASSSILIWFETTIAVHIFKTLKISKDDIFTFDEWSDDMLIRFPFFGELLSCPLCLSVWVSIFVSTCIAQINELSLWFIPSCAASWPILIFIFFKACIKRD